MANPYEPYECSECGHCNPVRANPREIESHREITVLCRHCEEVTEQRFVLSDRYS